MATYQKVELGYFVCWLCFLLGVRVYDFRSKNRYRIFGCHKFVDFASGTKLFDLHLGLLCRLARARRLPPHFSMAGRCRTDRRVMRLEDDVA
jgi:hypothetical protein